MVTIVYRCAAEIISVGVRREPAPKAYVDNHDAIKEVETFKQMPPLRAMVEDANKRWASKVKLTTLARRGMAGLIVTKKHTP